MNDSPIQLAEALFIDAMQLQQGAEAKLYEALKILMTARNAVDIEIVKCRIQMAHCAQQKENLINAHQSQSPSPPNP